MAGKATNGKTNKHTGDRNPERTNGKAWKKEKIKPTKVRTPERQAKDEEIRRQRLFKNASARDAARIKKAEKLAAVNLLGGKLLLMNVARQELFDMSYGDEGGPGV